MHPNQEINEIIQRINQGIASESDKDKLEAWYNSFDDTQSTIYSTFSPDQIKESIWHRVSGQLFNEKIKKFRKLYIASAAAAAVVAAGFFFYPSHAENNKLTSGVRLFDENGNGSVINSSLEDFLDSTKYVGLAGNSTDLNVRVLQTGHGEFIKVILPDGSKVAMNSNTKIQLKKNFGEEGNRIVYLDGEAFFDVKKHNNQKFIVRTKDQSIEVLGTKFNVKSYAKLAETVTVLYEGKIKLRNEQKAVMVAPNEVVTNDGEDLIKVAKDVKHTTSWRQMKFSFEEELIQDVIEQLSNWYGFQIQYQDEIPVQRISGELEQGMKLKDVLLVLENLSGAKCQLSNNILTIQFSK
ncbi:FecR family protein [Sphingobacterium sp. SGL-16]|uniref:FecR family protein n=1 Tax=Sphingobacterium sp. SGL-16 TaxID=2710883 RepID=UPI0013EBFA45|nr:FecR domain-containing protein [Sphingobacterium sp. SGL-16]NGM72812.1 DUF4974 domain-containing protein [Sphingobacterium sp. SGL-16]